MTTIDQSADRVDREADDATDGGTEAAAPSPPGRSSVLGRPLVAVVLLLALYVGLSFANDANGYLGTDTGGKVLTLQAMEARGEVGKLDVGYWAQEWDPDGDLHGYFGTTNDDGSWVQVTTVPMMLAARPLWDAGGYQLTLVLPMLGGVLVALAARSLARRLGGDDAAATTAFWVTGLAGPVLLYALDLWEHTLGLAAMAWATVALFKATGAGADAPLGRGARTAALACAAGLLWGVGFSMRTESLLYGAVVTAVVCLDLARRRRLGGALLAGGATSVGLVVGILANSLLERTVLGHTMRAGRAEGAAGGFASEAGTRLREGLITTVGLDSADVGILFGLVAVVALAMLVRRSTRPDWQPDRPDVILGALAVAPVAAGLAGGLAFVPGFLVASPVAVVGLALGMRRDGGPATVLAVTAVAALPLVWAFQYIGGAGPQWGGRYVLLSSFVLTVIGAVRLSDVRRPIRRFVLGAAAIITIFGFAWMVVRTHGFADAGDRLATIDEPVLIAKDATGFLPREFVAENGQRRWLATSGDAEFQQALDVVDRAGFDRFGVLVLADEELPDEIDGMRLVDRTRVELVPGAAVDVVAYAR